MFFVYRSLVWPFEHVPGRVFDTLWLKTRTYFGIVAFAENISLEDFKAFFKGVDVSVAQYTTLKEASDAHAFNFIS